MAAVRSDRALLRCGCSRGHFGAECSDRADQARLAAIQEVGLRRIRDPEGLGKQDSQPFREIRRLNHGDAPLYHRAYTNTTTRLYFRMGVRGPLAPEKPYSVGVRGAALPPLAPPLRMESGGLCPPDLPTLVVVLIPLEFSTYPSDGRPTTKDQCHGLPSPVLRRA